MKLPGKPNESAPNRRMQGSTQLTNTSRRRVNWPTTMALLLLHAGAVAALFALTWDGFFTALFLIWVAGGVGISMGYHRLHTHRSYQVPLVLEYFFAICGALALEGGPIFWVATHRLHHQKADQPGDPHSPRDGAWWAHMGWIVFGDAHQSTTQMMSRYAPDLAKHRFYTTLNDYHWVPTVVLSAFLFALGGMHLVLWGICLRVVVGHHGTWLVNSGTHMWGTRRFATRDDSRNNWWVAILSFGEGWHNNHHAHPTSARHGLAWYEFDASWMQIRFLQFCGIAKSVHVAQIESPLAGAALK